MSSNHYVCFDCRKQFQKVHDDRSQVVVIRRPNSKALRVVPKPIAHLCPQCGKEMRLIGKNFRAPQQDDTEGWRVAQTLLNAGFGYWGTWGPYPTRLKDVPAFIQKHRRKTDGEQILERWQGKT